MSDGPHVWVAPGVSRLHRQVLTAAAVLGALQALALASIAAAAPKATLLLGATASVGAAAWFLQRARRPQALPPLRIAAAGALQCQADGTTQPLAPLWASRLFCVLQTPVGGLIAVWHDAVSVDFYRRLSVACRWPATRDQRRVHPSDADART